jgi:aspartate carbamoyltransferase catalytic subunit
MTGHQASAGLLGERLPAAFTSGAPDDLPVIPRADEWLNRRHVLDLDDFSRGEIEHVFDTADGMKTILARPIKKVPTLRGKTVITLFYEASTRTRVSFEMAAKILGADAVNITASASSVTKGESLVDTLKTIQATGADLVVMRHPLAGAPYLAAAQVKASIVNGGDGWHAHPTQGLLDLYTVREHLGRIDGLKVVIVGDVLHSRVARTNCWGFTRMGARLVLCGPPTLLPNTWRSSAVFGDGQVEIETNLDRALEGADVVMALRLQRERQATGLLPSIREYCRLYGLNSDRMRRASPRAIVMHPGPMNEGVEISSELAYGEQSVIEDQVTNGVAIRMALLYLLAAGQEGA